MAPVGNEASGIRTATPTRRDRTAAPGSAAGGGANRWALFLDVDGTLLDMAPRPESVQVPPGLVQLLRRLREHFGGALALLSGRPLSLLDDLFAPLRLPGAGLHGLEIRHADGTLHPPATVSGLDRIRAQAQALAAALPGVLLEDKRHTLALHYRQAPLAGEQVQAQAQAWLEEIGPGWCLQQGKAVVELRPDGMDKGSALLALSQRPPFAGRCPLVLGDDLTDEDAFAMARRLGGEAVLVGNRPATQARWRLPDPAAARAWLRGLLPPAREDQA